MFCILPLKSTILKKLKKIIHVNNLSNKITRKRKCILNLILKEKHSSKKAGNCEEANKCNKNASFLRKFACKIFIV